MCRFSSIVSLYFTICQEGISNRLSFWVESRDCIRMHIISMCYICGYWNLMNWVLLQQMASLEDKSVLDFENEIHDVRGSLFTRSDGPRNRVLDSIKIVVLSNKINLLMVFGPLTILLDLISDNHVSSHLSFFLFFVH